MNTCSPGRQLAHQLADPAIHRLLYRVAHCYYLDGLTQQQIADRFGLSRPKVSRLLTQARQQEVVRITLVPPASGLAELERELEARFDLLESVIVPVSDSRDLETVKRELGPPAAACLQRHLAPGATVGIAWGASILSLIGALHDHVHDLTVVQLLGGLAAMGEREHSSELARSLGHRLGAKVHLIPAPGIVSTPEAAEIFRADPEIADTLARAAGADIALVGLGILDPGAILLRDGAILTKRDVELLKQAEVAGDVALCYIDAEGQPLDLEINARRIGLSLDQIKAVPCVIGVAGGDAKYRIIRAALLGGVLDVLVTDETSARTLLSETDTETVN